jgi:hypothetical protein
MFFNYDNNINKNVQDHTFEPDFFEDVTFVKDIKGNILGIRAKYNHPIKLYFHLEDLGSAYLVENNISLYDLIMTSKVVIKFENLACKVVLEKTFEPSSCYDYYTNDLYILLDTEDIKDLKQESYRLSLNLV